MDEKAWRPFGRGALSLATQLIAAESLRLDADEALKHPWLAENLGAQGCCVIA